MEGGLSQIRSQLYLYPHGYGIVVLVGLIFAIIICYICKFVTYNLVSHYSCNMGTHGLPDIYTLSPWACGPHASGVYQANYVTTI